MAKFGELAAEPRGAKFAELLSDGLTTERRKLCSDMHYRGC